jgi:peptidoglycan hydrolase-like protein with peptidoglycan-binding domain
MAIMSGVADRRILAGLAGDEHLGETLRLGAAPAEPSEALDRVLFYVGFGAELDWARHGADGTYDEHTQTAVAALAAREGIAEDGERMSSPLLTALLARYDVAVGRDLTALSALRAAGGIESVLRRRSPETGGIRVLQRLLYVAGYGAEMKWEKFGDDGGYGAGTARAVAALGAVEGLAGDGAEVGDELADRLIDAVTRRRERPEPLVTDPLRVTESSIFVEAPEGTRKIAAQVRFKGRRGWEARGDLPLADVVEGRPEVFAALPASIRHVVAAVVQNEGAFDAVNAYDNAFLSFGIFQWTAGVGDDKGELGAFLASLVAANAPVARKYFGAFGLETSGLVGGKSSPATAHLVLHGVTLNTAERKAPLRDAEWVYRFWKAGHDSAVQQAQVQYALARAAIFYRNPSKRVRGRLVADWVSSEVGVALLLDQHVNRPGHVPATLAQAVDDLADELGEPDGWDDDAEGRLLDRYLILRARTSMTDAVGRGARIRALAGEALSSRRSSFVV